MKRQKMSDGESDQSGTSGSEIPAVKAEAQDTRPHPLVLVATKTFEWRLCYAIQNVDTIYAKFPVGPGSGLPPMTVKLSICKEYDYKNGLYQLKLRYDLFTNEEGKVCPMYEVHVSAQPDGASKTIHQSAIQNTGGSCTVPVVFVKNKNAWIKFDITFHFYCNRNIPAINFGGDSWNERHQPSSTVDMLDSGLYSDVKIISSDGQEFNAHKLFLRGKNEVFDAMFRHQMKETKTGVVKLDDMSAKAVNFLLHFIYSTQLLKISTKENDADGTDATMAEVLYLVDKFGLTELKNYLDENFGKFCDKDNSWYLFKLSKLHSLDKGRKAVYEFMKENNSEFLHDVLLSHA